VEQAKGTLRVPRGCCARRIRETQRHINTATGEACDSCAIALRLEASTRPECFYNGFGFGRESACSAKRAAQKPVAPRALTASASAFQREFLIPKEPAKEVAGQRLRSRPPEPKLEATTKKKETSAASSAGLSGSGLGGRCQWRRPGREGKGEHCSAGTNLRQLFRKAETPMRKAAVSWKVPR